LYAHMNNKKIKIKKKKGLGCDTYHKQECT
jgi:hypothetical protein